ncbi:MAG: hypothetical protein AAB955_03405 [Patescibacteria group bacterium]
MATKLEQQLKQQAEQYKTDSKYRAGVDELCKRWIAGVAKHKIKLTVSGLITWIAYQQMGG